MTASIDKEGVDRSYAYFVIVNSDQCLATTASAGPCRLHFHGETPRLGSFLMRPTESFDSVFHVSMREYARRKFLQLSAFQISLS
jgi:hypothetical protein